MRVLVVFIYLCLTISSPPAARALLTGSVQEQNLDFARVDGDEDQNRRSGIMQGSKYSQGAGSVGARGGGSSRGGVAGNGNGESNGAAGAGATPVIVAGAASNHHPNTRHSAASHNNNRKRLLTLILPIFASLVMHV